MGTGPISTAVDGNIIPAEHHNELKSALSVDHVPRNNSGVATANAGSLGTNTFPWLNAEISTGYFFPGMIMPVHDFNGTVTPGQGWMKCDGTVINETNYNTIHGAGSWDTYIGASPLDGKNTPNMVSRYPVGVANTTQDGSSPITEVGNASSQITTSNHTHTTANHNHKFYESNPGASTSDQVWDAGASLVDVSVVSTPLSTAARKGILAAAGGGGTLETVGDSWTANAGSGVTGSAGSEVKNIQPASIELEYWIRIV